MLRYSWALNKPQSFNINFIEIRILNGCTRAAKCQLTPWLLHVFFWKFVWLSEGLLGKVTKIHAPYSDFAKGCTKWFVTQNHLRSCIWKLFGKGSYFQKTICQVIGWTILPKPVVQERKHLFHRQLCDKLCSFVNEELFIKDPHWQHTSVSANLPGVQKKNMLLQHLPKLLKELSLFWINICLFASSQGADFYSKSSNILKLSYSK